jgi:uncharacterized membrane protein
MPKREDYHLLIEREWADLHHSRAQEWTALGVVTGAHLGLIQLVGLAEDASLPLGRGTLVIVAGVLAGVFCILGGLLTCRHRQLMKVKLGWIYEAERRIGLIKTKDNPKGIIPENAKMDNRVEWRGLAIPRLLSTSGLILSFYTILFLVDVLFIISFACL